MVGRTRGKWWKFSGAEIQFFGSEGAGFRGRVAAEERAAANR